MHLHTYDWTLLSHVCMYVNSHVFFYMFKPVTHVHIYTHTHIHTHTRIGYRSVHGFAYCRQACDQPQNRIWALASAARGCNVQEFRCRGLFCGYNGYGGKCM